MKKVFKVILRIILILIVIVAILSFKYVKAGYQMYKDAISEKPINIMINEIEAKENYTKIEDVPALYINAVVSAEDHRFYMHKGVDIWAIIRAIVTNISKADLVEGGSTITQQICKNVYFTQDRRLERKIAEVFAAIELEKNCDKDKILELYFNTSFYGNGYYTLSEAAKGYFGKETQELTDYEMTMIAGIPNAPSIYNPVNSLELAKQRQKQVLATMVKYGYIDEIEKERILNEKIDLSKFEK